MPRKQLAYSFKNEAKQQLNLDLLTSHAHELIAAYFGFSSLAGMDSDGVILEFSNIDEDCYSLDDDDEVEPDRALFYSRAQKFGCPESKLEALFQLLLQLIESTNLLFISYGSDIDYSLSDKNKDAVVGMFKKGHCNAVFLLQCERPKESDLYWYKQKQAGENVPANMAEFAIESEKKFLDYQLFRSSLLLLETADNLCAETALLLAKHADEDQERLYVRAAELGSCEAKSVLATGYEYKEWLEPAAKAGCASSLELLARRAADGDTNESAFEAHKWIYLSELYGYNLIQSTADNDEDYGPVFVLFEGIELPNIPEKEVAKALAVAQKIYAENSPR